MGTTVSTRRTGFALTFATLLVCIPPAAAQPSITSVMGSLTHGSTVTVAGGSFGTKSTAAPVMWETFDSGSYHSRWDETQNIASFVTVNQRHPRTTRKLRLNFNGGLYGGSTGHSSLDSSLTSNTWFLSYWFYLDSNFSWPATCSGGSGVLANVKAMRLSDPGEDGNTDVFIQIHHGNCIGFETVVENHSGSHFPLDIDLANTTDTPLQTWHHLEMEYVNSSVNTANGRIRVFFNGLQVVNATNVILNKVGSSRRPLDLTWWDSWGGPQNDDNFYYQDDTYADTSLARVYLCPGNTFANRGRCELQPPTAWSASSISVQVNQGAFTNGQAAYLYVVNSTGQVNANGFPVTVAGSAPNPPQNLRIVS